jgi:NADPH:quinone reductase
MMKGISVAEFGGPDVMKVVDIAMPAAKEGEVLVKVYAAGINPVETYKRAGAYAKHLLPDLPFTPGADGAGVVEALGAGVSSVAVGDRVWLSGSISGTYAEYCVSRASDVHPLPLSIAFKEGAGIGTAYRTAYRGLFTRVKGLAKSGQTVLVHGASGGVGLAAIQLAKAQGCEVIGTAGTEDGLALISALGATAVSHKKEGYIAEIKTLSPEGVDVILEMAAHINLGADLPLLRRGGTVVVIGNKGMTETNINPRALMLTESQVVGLLGPGSPEESKEVLAGKREREARVCIIAILVFRCYDVFQIFENKQQH